MSLREWDVILANATPGKHELRYRSRHGWAATTAATWTFIVHVPDPARIGAGNVSRVIGCACCGWLCDGSGERRAWEIHLAESVACSGADLLVGVPRRSGRMCIKGHICDALGICWDCRRLRAEVEAGVRIPARAR